MLHHLLIALGIGLLVGAERERRKALRTVPAAAGLRTFTIAALFGAGAQAAGGIPLLAAALACTTLFAGAGYLRAHDDGDPGLTTEFALVLTVLLGGLAADQPALAAGAAVVLTIVLAARQPLHRFVGQVMSENELADLLVLAGATLVILPLLPDRAMGPFQAINPHGLWLVAILILAINAAGQVAIRWLGARAGVPLLGLASGFVSSSATIAAMGAQVRGTPAMLLAGAAAAVLSTVATFVQLAVVIGATDLPTLRAVAGPLLAAIAVALLAGGALTVRSWRQADGTAPTMQRSFGMALALGFAAMLGAMLVLIAALREWLGTTGLLLAAALGGVLDVHGAAIAIAAQAAAGDITTDAARLGLLVSWTTSTAAKIVFALAAGPRGFGWRVTGAQLGIVAAAWGAWAAVGGI